MPIPRAIIPLVPIVGVCISAPAKAHPTFDLTFTSSVGTQARNATIEAAANWSAVLADNVTIKLTIGFSSLSSGVVASATAAERTARNTKRRYLHTSDDSLYGRERGVGTGIAVEALLEG